MTLLSAPLELGGEWGGSPPNAALAVISRCTSRRDPPTVPIFLAKPSVQMKQNETF